MRAAGFALLVLALGCSSTSTNTPSGTGGAGGAAGGAGGTGGASGGSAGAASGGAAGTASILQCAAGCSNAHSAKEFLGELKNYVCGDSPCQGFCPAVCKTVPSLEDSCLQCLFQENVPSSVKDTCTLQAKPECVDFAQCLESCSGS